MAWLNQVAQITLINLRNVPRRLGTSHVVAIASENVPPVFARKNRHGMAEIR